MIRYPRDGECALIARLAYEPIANLRSDSPLEALSEIEQKILSPYIAASQGWQLIPSELGVYEEAVTSYIGVAYVNHQTRQIVIAHCSKEFPVEGPLESDYQVRLWDRVGKQMTSALNYTCRVLREFQGELDNRITPHSLSGYQLSMTGHALGAFLAEIIAAELLIKYDYLIHTVTFDSPGSLATIHEKLTQASAIDKAKSLDIVTYLSSPNLVNICNAQAGQVIQMTGNVTLLDVPQDVTSWFLYTLSQTRMTELVAAFDSQLGELTAGRGRLVTTAWPHYNFVHETSEHYQKFASFIQAVEEIDTEINFDEEFKLTYGALPQSQALISNHYLIRYLHPLVREFLKGYLQVQDAMVNWLQHDRDMVDLLGKYQLPPEKPDCLVLSKGMNAKQWLEQIMNRLGQHPEYIEHLAAELKLGNSAVAKQTTIDYPAILTLIGPYAKISSSTIQDVEQVVANIGAHATEAHLAFIQHNLDKYPIEMLRIVLIDKNAQLTGVNIRGVVQSVCRIGHNATKSEEELKKSKPSDSSKILHDYSEFKQSDVSRHISEGELKMHSQNTLIGSNANISGSNISGNQTGGKRVHQGKQSTYIEHQTNYVQPTEKKSNKETDPRIKHIKFYIKIATDGGDTLNQYFQSCARDYLWSNNELQDKRYADCRDIKLKSLADCSFDRINFSEANFEKAKFNGLNLSGLNLYRTRIDGADFSGTRGLSAIQLARAKFTFFKPVSLHLRLKASDVNNRPTIEEAYRIKPGEEFVYLFTKYLSGCTKTGLDCLNEFSQIINGRQKTKQKFERLLELLPQQDLATGLDLANKNTTSRIGAKV